MPDRREFLQFGIALSLAPLVSAKGFSPALTKVFDQVIFDERFPEARDFAYRAGRAGLRCAAIRGDITDVYFHDLALRWQSGPTKIAGVSTKASLFCLEMLARDHGMRLVYLADAAIAGFAPSFLLRAVDGKPTTVSLIDDDSERLTAWVIAPRGASLRGLGEM